VNLQFVKLISWSFAFDSSISRSLEFPIVEECRSLPKIREKFARGTNLHHQRPSRGYRYLEYHTVMAASPEDSETLPFASKLADLYARQDVAPDERWGQVASTARSLADRLRTREGEGQPPSCILNVHRF
jgi:hypothetical protein